MKKYLIGIIFSLVICSLTDAQQITAEKILLNVKANFDAVKDYSAMITAKVEMERLRVPTMSVKIYFKQPNKFKTESKNTSLLPRNVLDINPSDLITKFDAQLMGKEQVDGDGFYKLRLVTKAAKGKQVRESYIWIEEKRWVISRLEMFPTEGRKIVVKIENTTIENTFNLPSKITANFDIEQNSDSLAEKIYSPNRMPKKGMVEIIYSDYQVNKGLSDEFFEQKEKK